MTEASTAGWIVPVVDAFLEGLESVHVNETGGDCDDG
jgi:hypothetical protein